MRRSLQMCRLNRLKRSSSDTAVLSLMLGREAAGSDDRSHVGTRTSTCWWSRWCSSAAAYASAATLLCFWRYVTEWSHELLFRNVSPNSCLDDIWVTVNQITGCTAHSLLSGANKGQLVYCDAIKQAVDVNNYFTVWTESKWVKMIWTVWLYWSWFDYIFG